MLSILDSTYLPHQYLRLAYDFRGWSLIQERADTAVFKHSGEMLVIPRVHAKILLSEWSRWKKWYLPFAVRGMTVLDVGAGGGETAHLFFQSGAKRVIAVELDELAVSSLEENKRANGWNMEIIPGGFDLSLLKMEFDLMKMDIDGAEASLLSLEKLEKPSIVETHTPELTAKFQEKFGMKVIGTLGRDVSVLSNVR